MRRDTGSLDHASYDSFQGLRGPQCRPQKYSDLHYREPQKITPSGETSISGSGNLLADAKDADARRMAEDFRIGSGTQPSNGGWRKSCITEDIRSSVLPGDLAPLN